MNGNNSGETVLIAGAGLVGSLLALLLAQRGYKVEVYEKRADMRTVEMSAGRSINLALSTRGWKALESAGIATHIRKVAIPMKGRMIHSVDGNLDFQAYGREDQAIYSVSRGGLNCELMNHADALPNVNLHFDYQCLDLDPERNCAIFESTRTGERREVQADRIFGADGAFSAVRAFMQKRDRFNYSQYYLPHGYKELCIPAAAGGGWHIEKNALHIWPRGQFMLIALPNMDGSFTCTLFLPFEGNPSFDTLDSAEHVQHFFRETFADALPLMPTLVDDFFGNPTSSLVTVKCSPWVIGDKVALIGDAAHAIVPFYGQGMNAGFEDCSVLIDCLDTHDTWAAALEDYQNKRIHNGDAIADLAIRNFVEMRDKVADARFLLRKKIEKKIHTLYPDRFVPIYSMVTFSHIPYNDALRETRLQDELLEKLMAMENIESAWESDSFTQLIHTAMRNYEGIRSAT